MINKIFPFLLIFIITGCSSFLQDRTIPSATGFATSLMPTGTQSLEVILTPTAAHIPQPTLTFIPSTPFPFSLTGSAIVSACTEAELFWYTKHLSTTYYVNDQWSAVVCSDDGIYTKVINEFLEITWRIPSEKGDSDTYELEWYWKPLLWSPDGKYLYLEAVCLCFIDSPWLIYADGYGLARLNLLTGQFDEWLKPNGGSKFSFSDDMKLFAFTPQDFYQLIRVRSLVTGEERTLSFEEKYNVLQYRWTPDETRLVIFTSEHVNNLSENGFSIFVYSWNNEALIKLVDKNNLNFTFPTKEHIEPRMYISDLTNDILELTDIYGKEKFHINIGSGEIISLSEIATPTP